MSEQVNPIGKPRDLTDIELIQLAQLKIDNLKRVRLQFGDVLFVEYQHGIDTTSHLKLFKMLFPKNVCVLVSDKDKLKFTAVNREKADRNAKS